MVAKREPKDPEFQALWEERLSRGLPPLMRSSLHRHEPDCWSDPFDAYLPGTFDAYLPGTKERVHVVRCKRTSTIKEVSR